jgi:site-specific recombinase XerD
LVLPDGLAHLQPEEAVFEAMLTGWARQQTSRQLSITTIEQRDAHVRRFAKFSNDWPWAWTPSDVEDWTASLRSGRARAHSTVRGYQNAVRLFCDYVTDARYGWAEQCQRRFGTHPVQVLHEWNTAGHVDESECRPRVRPLTRGEVQALFDHADGKVARARRLGHKGWVAAFRDATLFKTIYAFGLRRREAVMLDLADFSRNAKAAEFGRFGACHVRYGKAMRGSPPRRRTVLTVMAWSAEVLAEYVETVHPLYDAGPPMWPTERGGRIRTGYVDDRFAQYRTELGLPPELNPHGLRRSYVTHLIEDGWDPRFVQLQCGHSVASSTAIYTGVSSDYRNSVLRRALDAAFKPPGEGTG